MHHETIAETVPASRWQDYVVPQNWEAFTSEDHAVWDLLFARQVELLGSRVVSPFPAFPGSRFPDEFERGHQGRSRRHGKGSTLNAGWNGRCDVVDIAAQTVQRGFSYAL